MPERWIWPCVLRKVLCVPTGFYWNQLARLLDLSRRSKRILQVSADIVLISLSFIMAISLRLEGIEFIFDPLVWATLVIVLVPTIVILTVMGFYRAVVRFVSGAAMRTMVVGIVLSSLIMTLVNLLLGLPIPRSVPAIYMFIALFLVGGVRMLMRVAFTHSQRRRNAAVIIYGAGSSGRQLQASLIRSSEYSAVAFVDDAQELHGADIGGLRVHPARDLADLISRTGATMLLLAMPSLGRANRRALIDRLEGLTVQVRTVPGMADLVSGAAEVSDLREVAVEDLLGRDPVPPAADLMAANIRGKTVMVTGAGGSIGAELCRQIYRAGPACLVLYDISEYALYAIHSELSEMARRGSFSPRLMPVPVLAPVLGSVRDPAQMRSTLASFRVETLYHAAAYKHVPMVEMNVIEGLRNNVLGTEVAAEAAVAEGVQSFILISTDKAVRPTNVMGASKRMAELICQAWATRQRATRFSMVRFGNVLGSSGSVIPLFQRQIAAGGPITVTHPEITRYFMTINEAAQLVIQAGAMARGGDVFVLDMGEPVRIVDLALRMARLHGLKPVIVPPDQPADAAIDGDIAITFTALRPGEKLYEELLIGASSQLTHHPRIMTAREDALTWDDLSDVLAAMADACDRRAVDELHQLLIKAGTGYTPTGAISDLVWNEGSARGAPATFAAQ